jgi:hypothetical protein
MAPTSRLERLAKLIQPDIKSLPDRPVPPQLTPAEDDDEAGGVSLEQAQPLSTGSSKQSANEIPTKTAPVTAQAPANTDRRFVLVKGAVSSYNPGIMRTSRPSKTAQLPSTDLNRGDLAAAHHKFAPIQALAKYPYKFCNIAHSQDIATAFFDEGKFWAREWDL